MTFDVGCHSQIAAIELRADGLLHVLADAASRPLDEVANIMLETTNSLAQLQKYMSALEPTLAGLSYQPPPAAAIGGRLCWPPDP